MPRSFSAAGRSHEKKIVHTVSSHSSSGSSEKAGGSSSITLHDKTDRICPDARDRGHHYCPAYRRSLRSSRLRGRVAGGRGLCPHILARQTVDQVPACAKGRRLFLSRPRTYH